MTGVVKIFDMATTSWSDITPLPFIPRSLELYTGEVYNYLEPVQIPSPRLFPLINSMGTAFRVEGGYAIYQNELFSISELYIYITEGNLWMKFTPSWMYYSTVLNYSLFNRIINYSFTFFLEISSSEFPVNTTVVDKEGNVVKYKNVLGILSNKDFYIWFADWSEAKICKNLDPALPFQSQSSNISVEVVQVYENNISDGCNNSVFSFLEFWESGINTSCSMQGQCVNGECQCDDGFVGDDCSIQDCPKKCYSQGR